MSAVAISRWALTRDALGHTAGRFCGLLRSVDHPGAPAVGDWSIGEAAAHVGAVSVVNTALATGWTPPAQFRAVCDMAATASVDDVGQLNALALARDLERDPHVLAGRIGEQVELLLDATAAADGTEQVGWVGGIKLPLTAVLAHMLSELLVHGRDIARAEGRSFPITSAHARLVFEGFLLEVLASADAGNFAGERTGTRRDVCCELRLRGCEPLALVAGEGGVGLADAGARVADVHVSADPAVMLLVMYRRLRPLVPAMRGQLVVWGRRPWKLRRLMRLMQMP